MSHALFPDSPRNILFLILELLCIILLFATLLKCDVVSI